MKIIPLKDKRGKTTAYAIVDDEDFDKYGSLIWHMDSKGYVVRSIEDGMAYISKSGRKRKRQRCERLHRLILSAKKNDLVDHVDHNPLDNRKSNLRIANKNGNQRNKPIQKNNTSGYKGVSFKSGKYEASIKVNGKTIYLGRSITAIQSAKLYNEAAAKYHGEFAVLNNV